MAYYRVEFRPLVGYTFGNEQGAKHAGARETGKESYFIRSEKKPDQTTLLGAIRKLVLRNKGLLRTDWNYNEEELQKSKEAIGERSFDFLQTDFEFGNIKEISPLFLWNRAEQQIYVRNPFCNVAKESGFSPMEMVKPVPTVYGEISTPIKTDAANQGYDAKKGYSDGYIGLRDKKIVSSDRLFTEYILTGNQVGANNTDDSGFYKRSMYRLNEDYSFAVYLKADDGTIEKKRDVIELGKKKNPFEVTFTELENEPDLTNEAAEAFGECQGDWYYALSDVFLNQSLTYSSFAIVEEKYSRNLHTDAKADDYTRKRIKNERIHLIAAGSVFYRECPQFVSNPNLTGAGYNAVIKLGK